MALLGVHACVAVTAVTVQNTLGVKSFHEVPDGRGGRPDRGRGHRYRHPGRQDRDAGVVGHHRHGGRDLAPARIDRPARRRPGVRIHARRRAAGAVCAGFASRPTVPVGHAGDTEPRRGATAGGHRRRRRRSQRAAAKALHALGPRWALVKGGHLRSSERSCDLLYDGVSYYEFDAPRVPTGNDHGGGDTLATAAACALAQGFSVPDAVGFAKNVGDRMPARRLSAGARPRPCLPAFPAHDCPPMNLGSDRGRRA